MLELNSKDSFGKVLLEAAGQIRLVKERSSIGRVRQTAFERSNKDFIIANMDSDDIFAAKLNQIVSLYNAKCDGKLLWVRNVIFGYKWTSGTVYQFRL